MITANAEALEAKYAGKSQPRPLGEPPPIYAPGQNIAPPPGGQQGTIPVGTPVPEGTVISQRVGRGLAPSMMVVPPGGSNTPNGPQVAVVPPTGSGRTSIGTFVETQPLRSPVSANVSNPMTAAPPPINSGVVDAPVNVEKPKSARKKVDLTLAILDHMHELGGPASEDCQKFYDRSAQSLKSYMNNPGTIPLACVLRFGAKKPGIMEQFLDELEPHFNANGQEGWVQSLPNRGKTNCSVLSPILGHPTLPYHWVTLYLAKKYEMGFETQADTAIWRSRNMLAHRFLASGVTWSLWIDADMAPPIANPTFYKSLTMTTSVPDEYATYDVWDRLSGHGKAIIGAVYASRRYHGQLVIQPEIRPRNHEDKILANEIRRGTARGLAAVDWIGFGVALVHRAVFLEVQRRFPQLAPESEFAPWRFFQPEGDEGEDEAFCKRARACEIPIWLDTQLVAGHVGNMCFMPEHTMAMPTL
jgi:hypothetical protein